MKRYFVHGFSPRAMLSMTATILGPVERDDDADLRVSLRESAGVASRLNFLRLVCGNGAEQEWGAAAATRR